MGDSTSTITQNSTPQQQDQQSQQQPYILTAPEDFHRGKVKRLDLTLQPFPSSEKKPFEFDITSAAAADTSTTAAVVATPSHEQSFEAAGGDVSTSSINAEGGGGGSDEEEHEVTFKKNPYYQEDHLSSADLEESEEVKLLARVVSDLNSHPVVILGHDRLTEDEVKLFQRQ